MRKELNFRPFFGIIKVINKFVGFCVVNTKTIVHLHVGEQLFIMFRSQFRSLNKNSFLTGIYVSR